MEQDIKLPGGTIHLSVAGQGPATRVLLPGLGEPCPILEMKPLASALQDHLRVISLEPYGYGGSDPAPTPRTIENICEELHQVMKALGIEKYTLAAHSISGIYALYHLHQYAEEVSTFVGLDISVPCQFTHPMAKEEIGLMTQMRQEQAQAASEEVLSEIREGAIQQLTSLTSYPFSPEELKRYGEMALKSVKDPTVLDEIRHTEENASKALSLKIPDELPAVMLIAKENTKRLSEWEPWHRAICGSNTTLEILDSDHYVHLQQTQQVAEAIRSLLLGR